MQTGAISFCDKQSLNIKSNDAKKTINDKLLNYGIKILQKHFEKFNSDTFKKLTNNPYLISIKSNGNPYLMFLTRFLETDICIMIDKKVQQGYFLPRMIIDKVCFHHSLFSDTIFDGEMIKDNNNNWIFMINDIVVNQGVTLDNVNFMKRLSIIHDTINTKYFLLPTQKFSVQVKKYFNMNDIDDALTMRTKVDYTSRGVLFKPMFPKFRDILHNFDDTLIDNTRKLKFSDENKFLDANHHASPSIPIERLALSDTTIANESSKTTKQGVIGDTPPDPVNVFNNKILEVEKTEKPDVYNLYENNKVIGIACISTLRVSKLLRKTFENVNLLEKIKMECQFSDTFSNKYTPVSVV